MKIRRTLIMGAGEKKCENQLLDICDVTMLPIALFFVSCELSFK